MLCKPIQFLPLPGVPVTSPGDRVTRQSVQGTKAAPFRSAGAHPHAPTHHGQQWGWAQGCSLPFPAPGRAVPLLMSFPD